MTPLIAHSSSVSKCPIRAELPPFCGRCCSLLTSLCLSLLFSAGDDVYALWGAKLNPENVTFRRNVAVNPGILRPNWYGNCVATYVSAERGGPALPLV